MEYGEYYRNKEEVSQIFFVEGQNRHDGTIRIMDLKNKIMCSYNPSTESINLAGKGWCPIELEGLTPAEVGVFRQYQQLRAAKQVELEHRIKPKEKKRRDKFEAEVDKAVISGIISIDKKLRNQTAGTSEKYTIMFPWYHWKWSFFNDEGKYNFNSEVADRIATHYTRNGFEINHWHNLLVTSYQAIEIQVP